MKFFSFICALISLNIYSQTFKTKSVDKSFFDEKKYEKYKDENAIVEHDIGLTYFIFKGDDVFLVNEVSTRIKILKNEGFKYGTIQVPLYRNRYNKEELIVSNAFTYNLENGKVVKSELEKDHKFLERLIGDYWYASFSMPNVKLGSVIEYKTVIISKNAEDVPEWFFQKDIPVKYSHYSFRAPAAIRYLQHIKGNVKIKTLVKERDFIFIAENVPPIKDEVFVTNNDNFRSSVVHYLSGYRDRYNNIREFVGNWNDVAKVINQNGRHVEILKKSSFTKAITDQILKDKIFTTDKDKISEILKYVQSTMTWNKSHNVTSTRELTEIFNKKSGNSAEINLLLIAILRNAGFKTYPVILATKQKGVSYLPHPNAFNNMIVGVEVNNEILLLDATDIYSGINIIPTENTNWIGRLIKEDNSSEEINLVPTIKSRKGITANIKLENDGSINGTVRNNLNNYEAYTFRTTNYQVSEEKLIEEIESRFKIEIESYQLNNRENISENLEESYSFKRESSFDVIGDKIYLSPMSFFSMKENPFKAESRTYPIDFIYPNDNAYIINYEIPEGYTIDYLPKSKRFSTGSNSVILKTVVNSSDTKVQVKLNLEYTKAFVEAHEYADIKQVFEEMVKFCDEKIVLKKI